MKLTKPGVLSKIMLAYSIILGAILFPFAEKHNSWGVYVTVVSLSFILTTTMFWISRKTTKEDDNS